MAAASASGAPTASASGDSMASASGDSMAMIPSGSRAGRNSGRRPRRSSCRPGQHRSGCRRSSGATPTLRELVYRQAVDDADLRCGQQQVKLLELAIFVALAVDYGAQGSNAGSRPLCSRGRTSWGRRSTARAQSYTAPPTPTHHRSSTTMRHLARGLLPHRLPSQRLLATSSRGRV